ncbi:MAG: sugar ABC transporter permease, partial [Ruminiclostridium sp.]|nr:sugar ABC transporter permease [Ruminiclostridium sp.]
MANNERSLYIEDNKLRYTILQMKRNAGVYGLIAPYFVLFLIFTIIPVLISLPMGFTNFNMAQFPQWVGLSNF